ncbi:hypothetical protein SpCBS45565_g04846 [Spizellomyces sp. 'palustris']|nr:hypothetical protein SpCBS45565_g04846 [Spizellomyces sp. 'palustris']
MTATTTGVPPFEKAAAFHLTTPPHPTWTEGINQPAPPYHGETLTLDPLQLAKPSCYKFLISSVVPRPIALVSTQDPETNIVNVAPFSYFNVVCHDPPTLMVSINYGRNGKKDTLRNILSSSEFVVNTMSEHFVESANHTTTNYPPHTSELPDSGLTAVPSDVIRPPRIAESAVSFECKVSHVNILHNKEGNPTTGVVLGEIVRIHVKKGVYNEEAGIVDLKEYRPVSRLGGVMYGRVIDGFELPRRVLNS